MSNTSCVEVHSHPSVIEWVFNALTREVNFLGPVRFDDLHRIDTLVEFIKEENQPNIHVSFSNGVHKTLICLKNHTHIEITNRWIKVWIPISVENVPQTLIELVAMLWTNNIPAKMKIRTKIPNSYKFNTLSITSPTTLEWSPRQHNRVRLIANGQLIPVNIRKRKIRMWFAQDRLWFPGDTVDLETANTLREAGAHVEYRIVSDPVSNGIG